MIPEEASQPNDEGESDGEAVNWALQLNDRKRLVIPESSPLAPLSSNPFYALSFDSLGLGNTLLTAIDEGSHPIDEWVVVSNESPSPFSFSIDGGGSDDEWEGDAMWVEPLAVSLAVLEENSILAGKIELGEDHEVAPLAITGPTSSGCRVKWKILGYF